MLVNHPSPVRTLSLTLQLGQEAYGGPTLVAWAGKRDTHLALNLMTNRLPNPLHEHLLLALSMQGRGQGARRQLGAIDRHREEQGVWALGRKADCPKG